MSKCFEKLPHNCSEHGHEKDSGDGLQVFQDNQGNFNGYCFSCGTYVTDPYGSNPPKAVKPQRKSEEELKAELDEIEALSSLDLPDRKLKKATLEYFGIKIGVSEYDGATPFWHYYPYTDSKGNVQGYKVRMVHNKAMWTVGSVKGTELFGWRQAIATGAKTLFITEGELDAAALFQALLDKQKGTQWENYLPAVVSIRSGASGAAADIQAQLQEIKANFKKVVLAFDQDDPGREATAQVAKVLPTVTVATLPAKDANAAVIEGRARALCDAVLFKSQQVKNTRIVSGRSLIQAARKAPEWGLSWPWPKLTDMTRGIRFGETYYLGAGVKMGKSELVNALSEHLMVEHKLPIFAAKPEEANVKTFKLLCGKVAGKIFHDPKVPFDFDAYDKAAEQIADYVYMLDLYQHMDWNTLQADIISAVNDGCKAIFIDPITNLTNGVASSDANTQLQGFSQDISAMAKDMDFIAFIFCHLKAPDGGPPHEKGGEVQSTQFAGSRAMMRSCNLMLALQGDKSLVDSKGRERSIEERNTRSLVVLEDREFGVTGKVDLYWNEKTGLFSQM